MSPPLEQTFTLRGPLDARLTWGGLRHGPADPTIRLSATEMWRATHTPEGPGAEHLVVSGGSVTVRAWGPGARWLVDRAPALAGVDDDLDGFDPIHPALREVFRRRPGIRIGRSDAVTEQLVPVVLEQKVQSEMAHASYRSLVLAHGEPAPGPAPLRLPPDPAVLAHLPYHRWHRFELERRRADIVRGACLRAASLERLNSLSVDEASAALMHLPGIGPWTTALVATAAWGDADAVPVGDFHLPHAVSWVLAGEPRGTDERMLELLEPYRGHRARVLRLLKLTGLKAPRYGPRLSLHRISAI